MAERNRRDDDAAEERVDDVFDDAVDDDAIDDSFDDDADLAAEGGGEKRKGGTAVKSKVKSEDRGPGRFGLVGRFFRRIGLFAREIVAELRKVIWPTRNELLTYTAVVVVFVTVMTAIVVGLDYLFAEGVLFVFGNPKQ